MGIRIRTQTLQNSCLHHDHDYHQIVIAYRGGAAFEVQGRGGQVDPFHGCLVPGGDVHFYEGIGDNSHIILDIPTENVGFKVERLFESAQYFDIDSGLRYLLAYMHRENKVWDSYPEAAEGITTTFLSSLHQRMFHKQEVNYLHRGRLDLVAIDEYIQQHIDEALPTSRLASVSNASAGHFHELFREAAGMTPGQYLFTARMKRAHQMIRDTRLPLIEIAEKVGFSSQSALTHAFRRFFGETPGQMRRKMSAKR
ncbi:helix-turn-helix domain-containing protein [Vibrio fluvialis]|uniref:helix-turn-helix domain-containing protein n=1 Tax=Vibrio fluvialis TaxID=676 RepID=UPI001ED930CE|nr:AraC family transcriptional regulator [Vibrio fluvialis]